MATAFIVLPVSPVPELTEADTAHYFTLREQLGYSEAVSDQRIEINENTTLLKWADLGLVETQEDAQKLLTLLEGGLPHHQWHIETVDYPDATSIVFYGRRYRLQSRASIRHTQ